MSKPLSHEEKLLQEMHGIDQFSTISSGVVYEPPQESGMVYKFKLAWTQGITERFNYDVAQWLLISLAMSCGLPVYSKGELPEILEQHNQLLKEKLNA